MYLAEHKACQTSRTVDIDVRVLIMDSRFVACQRNITDSKLQSSGSTRCLASATEHGSRIHRGPPFQHLVSSLQAGDHVGSVILLGIHKLQEGKGPHLDAVTKTLM